MPPLPDSLRQQLHFQHGVLQALLGRLDGASERVLEGDAAVQELRDAQRSLHDVLEVHLRQEEDVLEAIDGADFPPERIAEIHARHGMAVRALERLRQRGPLPSAAASRRLVRALSQSLLAEEAGLQGMGASLAPAPPAPAKPLQR